MNDKCEHKNRHLRIVQTCGPSGYRFIVFCQACNKSLCETYEELQHEHNQFYTEERCDIKDIAWYKGPSGGDYRVLQARGVPCKMDWLPGMAPCPYAEPSCGLDPYRFTAVHSQSERKRIRSDQSEDSSQDS